MVYKVYYMPATFIYGQVAFDFKVDGKIEKAVFDYRYSPSDDSIEYMDINYTNPKLQSMIENNLQMMQNIDSYINGLLDKKNSAKRKAT